MSIKSILLIPVALLLFLGLSPEVAEMVRLNPFRGGLSGMQRIIYPMLTLFTPLVVLLSLLRLTPFRLSPVMGSFLTVMVLGYGLIASVLLASGAGAGSGNALLHGFALTFALGGVVAFMVHAPMHYWGGNLSVVLLAVSLVAALYSLAGVPVAMVQTLRLADGNPYCLATRPLNGAELTSVPDLRNFSVDMFLGRDLTGRIDLYPNHILMVQGPGPRAFYYWSPAAVRFIEVTPDYPANGRLANVCTPRPGFLRGLRPV